jgi:hypothetical protein
MSSIFMDFNMKNRDDLLILSDEALAALCDLEFFKGSGPGGQKRNKSSSAVRVSLSQAPELSATDCTERSQHRNRANALQKLRLVIALRCRQEPPAGEKMIPLETSLSSHLYPLLAAQLLDIFTACAFDHRRCAEVYHSTPTAWIKRCFRDKQLFQEINRLRQSAGMTAFAAPGK